MSSTQDIAIAFSKKTKTLIHVMDEDIDNERDKTMNDLAASGCVSALSYIARPWVPSDARNATGDRLMTNGAAGVIELSACDRPQPVGWTDDVQANERLRPTPGRPARTVRQLLLTVKDDAVRNKPCYLAYRGIKWIIAPAKPGPPNRPPRRTVDVDGVIYVLDEKERPTI